MVGTMLMLLRNAKAPCCLSSSAAFSSYLMQRLYSTPRSSSAAADLAGENILLTDSPPSPVTPVIPSLLQPRVVVYDGVCHLCHGGISFFPLYILRMGFFQFDHFSFFMKLSVGSFM